MLHPTVTHYAPWTEDDDRAVCGRYLTAADTHSAAPTCPTCGDALAAEDALEALIELEQLPLDADEAHRALDPVLNAGVPVRAPLSPFGAELFTLARTLAYRTLLEEVAS